MLLTPMALALAGGSSALGDVVYQNDFESGNVGDEWSDRTVGALGAEFGGFLGRFERGTVRLTLGGGDAGGGNEPGSGNANNGGHSQPINGSRGGGSRRGGLGGFLGAGAPARAFNDHPGSGGGGGNPGVEPGIYNLTFDLYLFDSWDGLDPTFGEDRFQVEANGATVFDQALETFEPWENELGGWERPESNVYAGWARDLIYRDLSVTFAVDADGEALVIDFISLQNQVLIDESWGIDNVRLTRSTVRGASAPAVPSAPTAVVLLGGLLGYGRRRRG